jgi:hypothetical protein
VSDGSRTPLTQRRSFVLGVSLIFAAIACYLLFGDSDQRRVLRLVKEVTLAASALPGDTDAARVQRLRAALERHAAPQLSLSVPELGSVDGADAIVALLENAEGLRFDIAVEQSDVRVAGVRAQATFLVSITVNTPGEQRRQVRTLSFDLLRHKDSFRIVAITASAISREQPEARP